MKTIHEIRYENLMSLLEDLGNGDLTEMLRKSKSWHLTESENKLSRPTLDQILKRRKTANDTVKNIGDELARKIENEFKLDLGWMDNIHGTGQGSSNTSFSPSELIKLVTLFSKCDETGRRAVISAAESSAANSSLSIGSHNNQFGYRER